jgi:hypothetical protein
METQRLSNTKPTKTGMNSGAPDGKAVPGPLVASLVLLSYDIVMVLDTSIHKYK